MDARLDPEDSRFVKRYLKFSSFLPEGGAGLLLGSFVLVVCGLVLGTYAALLFVRNPSDYVAQFVLLPGLGGGLFLGLAGGLLFKRSNRAKDPRYFL